MFYVGSKKGVLIQWKLTTSEIFKSFADLLKPDIEETILKSKPGAYDKATEFDFVSLYPNIMLEKNISSDTISSDCCELESIARSQNRNTCTTPAQK